MIEYQLAHREEIEIGGGAHTFTIRHISDTHHGAEGFNSKLFWDFVKVQKNDKNSRWIHTGDLIDADRPSSRLMKLQMYADRRDAMSQEDKRNIVWLNRKIAPMYDDIKGSCLGIIDGDHYLVFNNGMTSGQWLARRLRVPYLGERSGWVNIIFKSKGSNDNMKYAIHARHGKGGMASHGADVNALVKQEANFLADLHLGGHTHKENCHPERIEYISQQGFIKDKIIWYSRGGSFLKNPEYARKAEYTPLPCGYSQIKLQMHRPRINGTQPLTITQSEGSLIVG